MNINRDANDDQKVAPKDKHDTKDDVTNVNLFGFIYTEIKGGVL